MAVDHFGFHPRDGIRVPLKPEHFKTYPGMTDELRKAISNGTYVWYFGWTLLFRMLQKGPKPFGTISPAGPRSISQVLVPVRCSQVWS